MENLIITNVQLNSQNINMWIAIDGIKNITVGHVCLNIEQNNTIKFLDAWVHDDYRRCGIYRKLWDSRWEYVSEVYKGYKVYAWCKSTSLPLYLEKNFSSGEIVTYVEKII
jgi:hypothetical protein